MTLGDSRGNVYVGRFQNTLGCRHTEYTQSMGKFLIKVTTQTDSVINSRYIAIGCFLYILILQYFKMILRLLRFTAELSNDILDIIIFNKVLLLFPYFLN